MSYNNGPKIVNDGLVMYLDAANSRSYSGTGTAWTDLTGSGANGTLTNGPTFNSANGGSIVLDGTNDYIPISVPSNIIRLYDSTIFFAVKLPLYSGGQRCIFSYRGGSGGNLFVEPGGILDLTRTHMLVGAPDSAFWFGYGYAASVS